MTVTRLSATREPRWLVSAATRRSRTTASLQRFGLPFVLLSDQGGAVRERYGVGKTLGFLPGRTTFVVDREGVIRHVFSSQFLPRKHVTEALAVLESLRGGH